MRKSAEVGSDRSKTRRTTKNQILDLQHQLHGVLLDLYVTRSLHNSRVFDHTLILSLQSVSQDSPLGSVSTITRIPVLRLSLRSSSIPRPVIRSQTLSPDSYASTDRSERAEKRRRPNLDRASSRSQSSPALLPDYDLVRESVNAAEQLISLDRRNSRGKSAGEVQISDSEEVQKTQVQAVTPALETVVDPMTATALIESVSANAPHDSYESEWSQLFPPDRLRRFSSLVPANFSTYATISSPSMDVDKSGPGGFPFELTASPPASNSFLPPPRPRRFPSSTIFSNTQLETYTFPTPRKSSASTSAPSSARPLMSNARQSSFAFSSSSNSPRSHSFPHHRPGNDQYSNSLFNYSPDLSNSGTRTSRTSFSTFGLGSPMSTYDYSFLDRPAAATKPYSDAKAKAIETYVRASIDHDDIGLGIDGEEHLSYEEEQARYWTSRVEEKKSAAAEEKRSFPFPRSAPLPPLHQSFQPQSARLRDHPHRPPPITTWNNIDHSPSQLELTMPTFR